MPTTALPSQPGHHPHHLAVGAIDPWLVAVSVVMVVLVFSLPAVVEVIVGRRQAHRWSGEPPPPPDVDQPPSPARPPPQRILASNAERDGAARRIAQAFGSGRMDLDEARGRLDVTVRARHRHELELVLADLPPPEDAVRLGSAGGGGWRMVAASLLVAATLLQVFVGSWFLWPVVGVVLLCTGNIRWLRSR